MILPGTEDACSACYSVLADRLISDADCAATLQAAATTWRTAVDALVGPAELWELVTYWLDEAGRARARKHYKEDKWVALVRSLPEHVLRTIRKVLDGEQRGHPALELPFPPAGAAAAGAGAIPGGAGGGDVNDGDGEADEGDFPGDLYDGAEEYHEGGA